MEYVVETAFGDWFATTGDVDTTYSEGNPVGVSFSAKGPVLLPAKS